jgi:hypothetical protein
MVAFGKFFGNVASEGAGTAIGVATANSMIPPLIPLSNAASRHFAHMPLSLADAAAASVRAALDGREGLDLGGVHPPTEASYSALRDERFSVLAELSKEHPGLAELLQMRRREQARPGDGISGATFVYALRHQGFEYGAIDAMAKLLDARLAPADVANAVQQGFMPNEGLLAPATPPQPDWQHADGPFTIPSEQVEINPKPEARSSGGVDADRLKILAELVGLPPGEEALIDMWRRGIINGDGYAQGLREGHTKTKWTAALSARFWQQLPPTVLVNLRLRGHINDAEYHRRMELHGYRDSQADDWLEASGRPPTVRQAIIGFRRGARVPGFAEDEVEYAKQAVLQADLRAQWNEVEHAANQGYPSLFQLNRLVDAGVITPTLASDWTHKSGYAQEVTDALAASWSKAKPSTTASYTAKAHTQLWNTLHTSYKNGETNAVQAEQAFGVLGIASAEQLAVLEVWDAERDIIRRQLTPSQLKKAWKAKNVNPATGQPWTDTDALDRLESMGYGASDAETFLYE